MALEIAKSFTIKAPIAAVWSFLIDPVRVARCLPGAAITAKVDEKTYTGTMAVKVGPVQQSYKGKIVFEKLDAAGYRAELVGTGQDTKGKGAADLKLTSTLKEIAPGTTEVTTLSLVNVSGILAQMGRGMISDVSDQMFKVFSERMRTELEAEAQAAAAAPATKVSAAPAATPSPAEAAPAPAPQAVSAASPAPHLPVPPSSPALAPAYSPATFEPSPPAEVLDLGAVGSKAAVNVLLSTLTGPALWIGIALGMAIDRWLFR